jgi:hypothetical protein
METFVIRIWTPGGEEDAAVLEGELHGLVEHVGGGKPIVFRKTEEMLSLIRGHLERTPTLARPSSEEIGSMLP